MTLIIVKRFLRDIQLKALVHSNNIVDRSFDKQE